MDNLTGTVEKKTTPQAAPAKNTMVVTMVDISEIKVDQERQRKRRRHVEAVKRMKGWIDETGLLNPLIVDEDRILRDGHIRLDALRQLGWQKVPAIVKTGDQLAIDTAANLGRFEYPPSVRVKIAQQWMKIEEGKARERQRRGGSPKIGEAVGEVLDIVSERVNWSGDTLQHALEIVGSGNTEAIRRMDEESVMAGFRELKGEDGVRARKHGRRGRGSGSKGAREIQLWKVTAIILKLNPTKVLRGIPTSARKRAVKQLDKCIDRLTEIRDALKGDK